MESQSPGKCTRRQAGVLSFRSILLASTLVNVTIEIIDQIRPGKIANFRREVVFHDEIFRFCRLIINNEL